MQNTVDAIYSLAKKKKKGGGKAEPQTHAPFPEFYTLI